MKESIGGVSLFNLVIFFVLLFAGYISYSLNYTKAYNVKNELVNIIKNQGGVCTSSSSSESNNCHNFAVQINDYFSDVSYHSQGNCPSGWVGYKRNGELATDGQNVAFCVKGIKRTTGAISNSELPKSYIYKVKLFYQLDIPIIRNLFKLSVDGETSIIYEPNECTYDSGNYPWC